MWLDIDFAVLGTVITEINPFFISMSMAESGIENTFFESGLTHILQNWKQNLKNPISMKNMTQNETPQFSLGQFFHYFLYIYIIQGVPKKTESPISIAWWYNFFLFCKNSTCLMNFGEKKSKIGQVEQILQLFKVERFVIFWTMNLSLFFTCFMLNWIYFH